MNKFIHAVVLGVFGFACWLTWAMLGLITHVGVGQMPGFTQLCVGLRPLLVFLPMVAAAYCIYVWIRKTDGRRSWVSFFATTMGVLVLVTLPAFVAAYLPLVSSINQLASK